MILGLIQLQRGKPAVAAEALSEAEQLMSEDAACSYYLGRALIAVGQTEQAAAAMERAIDRRPARNEALPMFTELGRIYGRAGLNDKAIADAVRRGALYLTSGPLLSVTQDGASVIGANLQGAEQQVSIRIDAAPWVAVEDLNIYVNGRLRHTRKVSAGGVYSETIHLRRDSVVVVEVMGPATPVYAKLLPGLEPIALTNPIYVDADGDGRWQPPGL